MSRRVNRRALRIAVVVALVVAFVPIAAQPAVALSPVPVWRFYNAGNGTHFYTASEAEAADVQAKYPTIYAYEGLAYTTWTDDLDPEPFPGIVPLYRFWDKRTGSHFYTISEAEKANIIAKWPTLLVYEGVAYDVFSVYNAGPGSFPVHRFYNKLNGSHFFTISDYEKTLLRMLYPDIYTYEGVAFYASPGSLS